MNKRIWIFVILICHSLLSAVDVLSQVRVPRLISNGMVLQRNARVNIWGWASAGEKVKIQFNGQRHETTTAADGRWKIVLNPMKAGGPFSMQIDASNHLQIDDILVGEVWVCSGQSNMVIPMERVKEKYPSEIASSKNSFIRQFIVPVKHNFNKQEQDVNQDVKWLSADPKSVLQFSATGYFFSKKLYEQYKVPVGVINSSIGGPPVEAWLSEDALQAFPKYLGIAQKFKNDGYVDSLANADRTVSNNWYQNLNKNDQGLTGDKPWYDSTFSATDWPVMKLPGFWSERGMDAVNGVVWFRKTINLSAAQAAQAAKLYLGRLIDADYTYVNGVLVGNITYQYPPRRYEVPAGLLKEGENTITVRLINSNGRGGFAIDKPYYLVIGNDSIDLKGEWNYKLGTTSAPLRTSNINPSYQPEGIFNGMIASLVNYTIKGVAWYQGEGSAGRPSDYHELLTAMIKDWRKKWGQGDFPFLIVQLPNFGNIPKEPGESKWAELREQQLKTLSVSNTAMVVAIDLGEWNDLHPLNKKDVGERLALAARRLAYSDKKVVYSGPIYKSMRRDGNRIILTFTQTGSGLKTIDGRDLNGFAIAGADKKFVYAKATISGGKVIVWNENIAEPVAVRYAWADNPGPVNLYNKEGLPASPFRTDSQPH